MSPRGELRPIRRQAGRRWRAVAATAALAATAVACGDDGGEADDAGGGATTTAEAASETEAAAGTEASSGDATTVAGDGTTAPEPADAPATPTQGGELIVGTIFDAFGLEPTTFVGGVTDAHLAYALYDPLMMLNPEGEPEPHLAESLETTDQQNYTVTLHDGVTFHDGTPLDAQAVKVNLERHMNPETESRALVNAVHIDSVTVVDDLTVEIALQFPWPAFPEILAGNLGLIASPQAIEAGTLNEEPVGSGPFEFVERVPDDHITMARNDDYWGEGGPYVDEITFRVILDDQVRRTSVENGEIHAAQSIRVDQLSAVADDEGLHATMTPGHVNTIHINTSAAPMDDVRVRQALAQAIDYEALNEVIYDGAAAPVHHFITSDSPFYDDSVTWFDHDPEAASALIEEYEAEHGPVEFTFRCYTGPSRVQLTEMVEQMWGAVGIDVTADISDQTSLVVDLFQKNYTAACFSMSVETTDPDQMWYSSLHSESASNYTGYANQELDAALDTGRTSTDEAARAEAYSTVQNILSTDVPIIQYASSAWGWIVSDEVDGVTALPGGEFRASEVFFVP